MAFNQHTVLVCTAALRQDSNNVFRAIPNEIGSTYDSSPVNSIPGTFSVPLAVTLNTTNPWNTPPTHFLAATWELPAYADMLASIKAGVFSAVDWAAYNLTAQRAAAVGRSLYTRTQVWDPNGPLHTYEVVAQNIAAALTELGLQRVPDRPFNT